MQGKLPAARFQSPDKLFCDTSSTSERPQKLDIRAEVKWSYLISHWKTRLLSELQNTVLSCTPIIHFFVRSSTCCAVSRKSLPAPGPDKLQRGLLNFSYPKQIHEATESRFITCHISELQHCFLLIPFTNLFIFRLKKGSKSSAQISNHTMKQQSVVKWVVTSRGPPRSLGSPTPTLGLCGSVCCYVLYAAWFLRHKHLHSLMKSAAVCFILFIYSKAAAEELFVSTFCSLYTNWNRSKPWITSESPDYS